MHLKISSVKWQLFCVGGDEFICLQQCSGIPVCLTTRTLSSFLHEFTVNTVFQLSPPSAAYMRQWSGSALVQIMACRLDGAKPLSEPMLMYCQLDPREHISMKFFLQWKYFIMMAGIWAVIQVCSTSLCMVQCTHLITTGGDTPPV